MAKILITGGSGLVGSALSKVLSDARHHIVHLSRTKTGKEDYPTFCWDLQQDTIEPAAFDGVDHVVHLAGAGVADQRWTKQRKQVILDSRVQSLSLLYRQISKRPGQLKSFVSASAIGYYGMDTGPVSVDESSPAGNDFLAGVVKEWERATDRMEAFTKVAKIRIGVVLSDKGGALPAIAKPIKYYLGAPLGSGRQYMSWLHLADLCGVFKHVLEKEIGGTYNAVAPNPVTNRAFTQCIASVLKRPLFLPNVPSFALQLILGEMSQMVLGGNNVSGAAIENVGYEFKFRELDHALNDLLLK